jgi:hypothetical protein
VLQVLQFGLHLHKLSTRCQRLFGGSIRLGIGLAQLGTLGDDFLRFEPQRFPGLLGDITVQARLTARPQLAT